MRASDWGILILLVILFGQYYYRMNKAQKDLFKEQAIKFQLLPKYGVFDQHTIKNYLSKFAEPGVNVYFGSLQNVAQSVPMMRLGSIDTAMRKYYSWYGFLYIAMYIMYYQDFMPQIARRMAHELEKYWPEGMTWRSATKYLTELNQQEIYELGNKATYYAKLYMTLPPEIKAKLDDKKQRKKFLKEEGII